MAKVDKPPPPPRQFRCTFHPEEQLRDEAVEGGVRSLELCVECDGPLELVDLVSGTWRRA